MAGPSEHIDVIARREMCGDNLRVNGKVVIEEAPFAKAFNVRRRKSRHNTVESKRLYKPIESGGPIENPPFRRFGQIDQQNNFRKTDRRSHLAHLQRRRPDSNREAREGTRSLRLTALSRKPSPHRGRKPSATSCQAFETSALTVQPRRHSLFHAKRPAHFVRSLAPAAARLYPKTEASAVRLPFGSCTKRTGCRLKKP